MREPWAELLDWSSFSVRLPPSREALGGLKAHLARLDYDRLARGVRAARAALRYQLDGYTGGDMLPLLLFSMGRVLRMPIVPPRDVATLSNDIEAEHDYNTGLEDVRSQRRAHSVETHAAIGAAGAVWDCASMDGYMCECSQRDDPAMPKKARRCYVSGACYDHKPKGAPGREAPARGRGRPVAPKSKQSTVQRGS